MCIDKIYNVAYDRPQYRRLYFFLGISGSIAKLNPGKKKRDPIFLADSLNPTKSSIPLYEVAVTGDTPIQFAFTYSRRQPGGHSSWSPFSHGARLSKRTLLPCRRQFQLSRNSPFPFSLKTPFWGEPSMRIVFSMLKESGHPGPKIVAPRGL